MKKRRLPRFMVFFAVLLSGIPCSASGHPHIFVDPAVTVCKSADGRTGLTIVWTWDPGWSYHIISAYDLNGDGVFNTAETENVFRDFSAEVETFHYFISLSINGDKKKIHGIENVIARATKEQIVSYLFFIPLRERISDGSTVKIVLNDDTITVGFLQDIEIRASGHFTVSNIVTKNIPPFGVQAEFTLSEE